MYRDSAIDVNKSKSYVGKTIDECYFFASDLDPTGINGNWSQHFYSSNNYQDAAIRVMDEHKRIEHPSLVARPCLIEDPILLADNHKYLIIIREAFGHYLMNTLCVMFSIYEKDKDAIFVFFTGATDPSSELLEKSQRGKLLKFLAKICSFHRIPFYFLKTNTSSDNYKNINYMSLVFEKTSTSLEASDREVTYPVYKAKNVSLIDADLTTASLSLRDIKNYTDKYIIPVVGGYSDPTRKVYITRGNYKSDPEPFYLDKNSEISGYKQVWDRLYGENLVEEYLESQGFETVLLETLDSVEDQIRLMTSTAVLVSATGTGLTNCLFMPDNGVLVELRIEIGYREGSHRVAKEYFDFSAAKKHTYVAMDVPDKQGRTALKKLQRLFSNFNLDSYLDEKNKYQ